MDHITPLALGGEDIDENVQPLCRPCHKAKTCEDFGTSNSAPATNCPFERTEPPNRRTACRGRHGGAAWRSCPTGHGQC
ncbi:HNH endonuclease [Kitasatospora sp. NPDC004614]|uniref:HNH endonuclease n=1 Tax=Kitasatospora sp. NPDC004614 TaxID=3364016 RepID=UPI0036921B57